MTKDEALSIARDSQPNKTPRGDALDPNGRKPGDRVAVMPDDYGRDPVVGTIVSLGPQEIAIARTDPRVGEVVVHFPRAGFWVVPA
jgi:hypothetical protein